MKRLFSLVLLLVFCLALWSVKPRVIDDNNEFGGVTVKTTYSTGMRYHNEDNVRETVEFFDADSVLVRAEKFLLNGKMGYETYENGVLRKIEWERPDRTFESIEYYGPQGAIQKIEWLNEDEKNPVPVRVEYYTGGVIERIEVPPSAGQNRLVEHYVDGRVTQLDIYNECDQLHYVHHFDELDRLRERDMYKPDGKLEKEFHYDEKERLVREVWYLRTHKKTIDYYENNRKVKTEFYDRNDRLEKVCYYNRDGVMTHCEKLDDTGRVISTERYDTE